MSLLLKQLFYLFKKKKHLKKIVFKIKENRLNLNQIYG